MIKMCIVEDDGSTRNALKGFIRRYAEQNGQPSDVFAYGDATSFFAEYSKDTDIVLMDIELPDLNGLEAVRKLRLIDSRVIVIFVTNLAQYAVKGYEVNAFDFIVKPVSYYQFAMKLRRALEYLHTLRNREIWVTTRHGKRMVAASELRYVEAMKHVITYHTTAGEVVGSGTLKRVLDDLEGLPFALCNRCYLVNLSYITEIKGNTVVVGGRELQIAAPRRKAFLTSFNEYLSMGGETKL